MLLAFALSLAPLAQDGLAPLDRLAGHCWQGELKPGERDTHCFTRTDAGMRDHHEVVIGGATVYWGESDFQWDAAAKRIAFAYRNAGGPVASGLAIINTDGITFDRVQWIWIDATSYDMLRDGKHVRFTRVD